MSSYQSLLSLSPVDWIGGSEFAGGGDDDDDRASSASAAVSSYISSFDVGVGVEDFCYHPSDAAFHAEQEAPVAAPPSLFDPLQAAYRATSGRTGSSSEAGEPVKQSRTEASAITSEGHDNADGTRSLPATTARKEGKIAFKTRTEVDVLDDGYRWRKYGKKLVKNSPNPRNYYRCSSEGCHVKKRVERARDDARFVITTYDGVHNHAAAPANPLRGYRLLDPPQPQPQGHRLDF